MEENKQYEKKNPETMDKIIEELKMCYDPEIPVNIYDLGLVYGIDFDSVKKIAKITMTLTSPNCPAIETLPEEIQDKIETLKEVEKCEIDLVWDPPFTQEMMSEEVKLTLGLL